MQAFLLCAHPLPGMHSWKASKDDLLVSDGSVLLKGLPYHAFHVQLLGLSLVLIQFFLLSQGVIPGQQ